jgi:predicted outer membrane repeat protein
MGNPQCFVISDAANVTFAGNSAEYYGGGMYNWESSPALMNVTFSAMICSTLVESSTLNPTLHHHWEVREMRTAETVLNIIRDRSHVI